MVCPCCMFNKFDIIDSFLFLLLSLLCQCAFSFKELYVLGHNFRFPLWYKTEKKCYSLLPFCITIQVFGVSAKEITCSVISSCYWIFLCWESFNYRFNLFAYCSYIQVFCFLLSCGNLFVSKSFSIPCRICSCWHKIVHSI
jgi:hypothetical protein